MTLKWIFLGVMIVALIAMSWVLQHPVGVVWGMILFVILHFIHFCPTLIIRTGWVWASKLAISVNIKRFDADGEVLSLALRAGKDFALLHWLIQYGIGDPQARNSQSLSPLIEALLQREMYLDGVFEMLKHPRLVDINQLDLGMSLLNLAIARNAGLTLIDAILKHPTTDPNLKSLYPCASSTGHTNGRCLNGRCLDYPLDLAIRRRDYTLVNRLMNAGAVLSPVSLEIAETMITISSNDMNTASSTLVLLRLQGKMDKVDVCPDLIRSYYRSLTLSDLEDDSIVIRTSR